MDFSPLYNLPETTAEQRLAKVREYLDEIDPELTQTFDYMETYGLYDMDQAQGKADTGFTVKLPYYNDVFTFDSPYGYYYDYTTAIHEFGHYNYMFHNTENILLEQNNIDLNEIHSQGLEMLYYPYEAQMLSEEAGDLFQFMEVYQMANNTIQASLISEFEIRAYENENMSLEDLNKLYLNLSEKYGMYYNSSITELYNWVDIPHIFNSPCYYIGYATSAFSSLDLLTLSMENRHEAVEKYMELTTLPSYMPYREAVSYVGLRDIFEDGAAKKIMQETAEIMEKGFAAQ
jgi:oligoendopeptidase F